MNELPRFALLVSFLTLQAGFQHWAKENLSKPVEKGGLPFRVHVCEDYETTIEKRWWLRGKEVLNAKNLPKSLSADLPNTRAFKSSESKDFDRKMGDQTKMYEAGLVGVSQQILTQGF